MIQVQPQLVYLKDYQKLGLSYEIMDYAFPSFKKNDIIEAYKGISVPSMHCAFIDMNYASADVDIRNASQARIKTSIRNGTELGVKNVVLHTCFYPVLGDFVINEIWCDGAKKFINELLNEFDISIYVENTLDINPDVIHLLMEMMKDERVNVCLDVGHAFLSKAPLTSWFEKLHPYIKYMHINDNNGITDDHLAVGDGIINWIEVDELMKKYKLSPIVTIEVASIEKIERSLEFIDKRGIFKNVER